MVSSGFFEKVWAFVARIPEGKVVTYGQIAAYLGNPRAARTVGWAMHSTPENHDLPWYRVINSRGRTSRGGGEHSPDLQRMLLQNEGVEFDLRGYTNLDRYQWIPD